MWLSWKIFQIACWLLGFVYIMFSLCLLLVSFLWRSWGNFSLGIRCWCWLAEHSRCKLYWRWIRKAREHVGALWKKNFWQWMLSIVFYSFFLFSAQSKNLPSEWFRHYPFLDSKLRSGWKERSENGLCHVNESAHREAEEHADRTEHQNGKIISNSNILTIWLPISDE